MIYLIYGCPLIGKHKLKLLPCPQVLQSSYCMGLDNLALKATRNPEGDFCGRSLFEEIIRVTHNDRTVALVPKGQIG